MAITTTTSRFKLKGYEVALKNKIPALQSTYQPGDFDEKAVQYKIDQLLAESREVYKDKPILQRQIELALGQFSENYEEAINQTLLQVIWRLWICLIEAVIFHI